MEDLKKVQGKAIDIGGYYQPEDVKVSAAMRPSTIFNKALDLIA
jgi:isocitrate dehydrogenase